MTRPDGFQIADVDVGMLTDPKFRRLWRELHDQALMSEAVVLFLATLLDSWNAGCRVSVRDVVPMWMDPSDKALAALEAVELLTTDGTVSDHAWTSWFGPAEQRRERRRASGQLGGRSSAAKRTSGDAEAPLEHRLTDAEPYRPTVRPSVLPTDRDARDGLPNLSDAVAKAWDLATGRSVLSSGDWVISYLDDACRRHPEADVIASISTARTTFNGTIPEVSALAVAVKHILDPLPSRKVTEVRDDESKRDDASRRRVQATKARNHNVGFHADEADPGCDLCMGDKP